MRSSRSIPLLIAIGILILAAPVARSTTIQRESRLLPSDPGDGDNTGISVSIDGDVAIVGSVFHDGPGIDAGAAYVHRYGGLGWNFEQKLTPADAQPEDRFGRSVSVSGDVFGWNVSICGDLALIGAQWNTDGGAQPGASYLFRRAGATWTQEAKLAPTDAGRTALFGYAGSVCDRHLLVGAPWDSAGGVASGTAYAFDLIDPAAAELPVAVILRPELRVEPKPASSMTRIAMTHERRGESALVAIHDATGRLVRTLRLTEAGQSIAWDGMDSRGTPLPSGTYYARLSSTGASAGAVIILCR
jgi:hypothetical protein